MKKLAIAAIVAAGLSSIGVAHAQRHQSPHRTQPAQVDAQDLATAAEARIASIYRALRLNADQDKLWQPVESALRDFRQARTDRVNARFDAGQTRNGGAAVDADTLLRDRASNAAAESKALTNVADAAEPLHKALNSRQQRLLWSLIRNETNWRHPVLSRHPVLGE